jgi:serine/threonine protein kinase
LLSDAKRELSMLARFCRSPHVLQVRGKVRGSLSFLTEMMGGGHLDRYLRQEGQRLGFAERLRLGIEAAVGLRELHRRSVLHGDFKPENLLLAHDRYLGRYSLYVLSCP